MRKPEDFVPKSHPLRSIRVMANEALAKMDRFFAGMCEANIKGGRPSIPPEKLLRAMLIQVLYSIRSDAPTDGAGATQPALSSWRPEAICVVKE